MRQLIHQWSITFGTSEVGAWQGTVAAMQSILATTEELSITGFNPFTGWQTVAAHLNLPGTGEIMVSAIFNAAKATLPAGQVAASTPTDAALRDLVFGQSLAVPFDNFESLAAMREVTFESEDLESLLPAAALSHWWGLPAEKQSEELLLVGLLAATLWKPERSRRPVPGRRPEFARAS